MLTVLSLGLCRIDSEDEESRKATLSDDELFEPYSHKRWVEMSSGDNDTVQKLGR